MKKILFILKERFYSFSKTSYGLINSATHLATYLNSEGYKCKIVTVVDGNGIDKEVHDFGPDMVIIEALWCPTYKLEELINISKYKKIKWVVRVHSDIAFISCETQALKLIREYVELQEKGLVVSFNHAGFIKVLSEVMRHEFTYLPNVIITQDLPNDYLDEKEHIDIGCLGATRLLKNQCFQAICAIRAADKLKKKLRFHVTPNLDQGNDPILANLKELFDRNRHELVIHDWLPNDEFQQLVREMDIGLQVSFTETFNIVAADFINNNRIIIVSDAISWLPSVFRTSTLDYDDLTDKIIVAYKNRNNNKLRRIAKDALRKYNLVAKYEWAKFLHKEYGHHGKDKDKGRK